MLRVRGVKRVGLILLALIFALQSAPAHAAPAAAPAAAPTGGNTTTGPTSDQLQWIENFIKQNDVLYYDIPCGSTGISAQQSTGGPATPGNVSQQQGGGGGCGNQGYGSGKRDDQANMAQIRDFFKSKGLTDNAIAGIMGNMMTESAFMPDAVNGGGCTGIVQWCGGRNTAMRSFAQEQGKDPTCLGSQLDYLWHEVTQTGESSVMGPLNAATSPQDAANIWAHGFERPAANEYAGRADNAGKIASGFNGTPGGGNAAPASSTAPSSSPSPTGATGCQVTQSAAAGNAGVDSAGSTALGTVPSAECAATQSAMSQLHSQGKIKFEQQYIQQDIDNCTTGPITCGAPTGSSKGGANPNTLRGLSAIAMNSGDSSITLWNINSAHGCDKWDHPKGLASDIKQVDGVDCMSDTEQCKKVFDYVIANRKDLGISYVIWNGNYCHQMQSTYGFVDCNGDHSNHIHVSFNPAGGAPAS